MREQQGRPTSSTRQALLLSVLGVACVTLLVTGWDAVASSIKTWSTGETLKASDLNANFQHLHNSMVGGHGARLVDADVNAAAAIAHSKMATPALLPKAIAQMTTCVCADAADATTCTLGLSSRVTSIKSGGTAGTCRVTLAYTPSNTNFVVNVTPYGTSNRSCYVISKSTSAPHFVVTCTDLAAGAAETAFDISVWDD